MNALHYGDNLDVLRGFAPESVDLVYLDPPFNSNANYNVLFKSPQGQESQAQIEAFEDTWHWGEQAETYVRSLPAREGSPPFIIVADAGHCFDLSWKCNEQEQ